MSTTSRLAVPSTSRSVPPATGLNTDAIAVPLIVIASASNVPSTSTLPEISRDAAAISPENVELSSAVIAPTCKGA